jgi:hypothetical protein
MATWRCPFCGQNATLTNPNISSHEHHFRNDSKYGDQIVKTQVLVCPNTECKEYTLKVGLYQAKSVSAVNWYCGDLLQSWQLIPSSEAVAFPDYVPKAVLDDYSEACLIRDLSPKASATLSRRCLQGIIRDFWNVSKPRLIDEVEAIRDRVDPLTWSAIDAVRQIGNIGAHMEKDINVIIDVEPQEANLLIGLIETLIKDWYVLRHDRQEQLRAIVDLSAKKKQVKAQVGSASKTS